MSPKGGKHWILCGGAVHRSAPSDALCLSVGGAAPNVEFVLEGLAEETLAGVPAGLVDFVRIAAYVLAVDELHFRGERQVLDLGAAWRRDLHFVIAVENPDQWSIGPLHEALHSTMQFLSDDTYTFEFQRRNSRHSDAIRGVAAPGCEGDALTSVDALQVFSAGIGPLVGAVQALTEGARRLALVSHATKPEDAEAQEALVGALRMRFPEARLSRIDIRLRPGSLSHPRPQAVTPERSRRSRSFLHAAVGGLAAYVAGKETLHVYENGIASLNPPLSRQLVTTQSARTTHPHALLSFSRLLSMASGRPTTLTNPFQFSTLAEILESLHRHGAAELLRTTVGCPHPSMGGVAHCGRCASCIDRRFAVLACGLEEHDPKERYATDLVLGEWSDTKDRRVLLDYIATADRFAALGGSEALMRESAEAVRALPALMEQYAWTGATVSAYLLHLCVRHGQDVARVIASSLSGCAKSIRTPGALSEHSLPAVLFEHGLRRRETPRGCTADPLVAVAGDNVFRRSGHHWTLRFNGETAYSLRALKGYTYLHTLLARPGETLDAFMMIDLSEGRSPEVRPRGVSLHVDARTLAEVRRACDELQERRRHAEEFQNPEAMALCDQELEQLTEYLAAERGLGGKARREDPGQKKARVAVTNAITRAIQHIDTISPECARYLREQIKTGFYLRYRDTQTDWQT